ncbi:MAG: hypothetical protein FWD57_15360 [Polyangiaceae bacterium]|nr:hypothetical protein [Polyangiaceae bacterium]
MTYQPLPDFLANCVTTSEDAIKRIVKTGQTIASGFGPSEPSAFYRDIWGHIQKEDITDLDIRQSLFMAPHQLCVGNALSSRGMFYDSANSDSKGAFTSIAKKANAVTRKLEGLRKLASHYAELQERRIRITTPFVGATLNMVIPDNAITRIAFPSLIGRNTTRMGITDLQPAHFPDVVEPMGYPEGKPVFNAFICVLTPPNENGEMSHGASNAANGELLDKILARCSEDDVELLIYVNPKYPFTTGYVNAPNTVHVDQLKGIAERGKLMIVEDESPVPAIPKDSFANPSKAEQAIAGHVVNHIELHPDTCGRAIQVGIGRTGVLAVRGLRDSKWHGRSYTEMLEPYTLDLFDAGKIVGSHFIERDGRRTQLDGKLVASFSLGEEGDGFYERLHNNPAVVLAPGYRVVIPEGFYYGLGINNCLAMDFHGHVNSGGRFMNHHSGIGGAAMIWRGLSRGGIGYLCMKSTFKDLDGTRRSSIMPFLDPGTPISHTGPDLMGVREGARFYLVTEHGVARISSNSQSQFIRAIISVAHPDFRDDLREAAWNTFRVRG